MKNKTKKKEQKTIDVRIKLPKKITLLDKTWKIRQVKRKKLKCKVCGADDVGSLDPSKNLIEIATKGTAYTPIEVYLHELGHIFADYYDLNGSEIFAEAFAKFVSAIIKQFEYEK